MPEKAGSELMEFFFDTYAIIEFLKSNPRFQSYFNKKGITSRLNLMEVYFQVLKIEGEQKADTVHASFSVCCEDYDEHLMKEAMKFRLRMMLNGKDVSYADAIGYQMALKKGLKFLTGDKEFRGMENIEFVR
jgi:predicted nucleic acid-binding protein